MKTEKEFIEKVKKWLSDNERSQAWLAKQLGYTTTYFCEQMNERKGRMTPAVKARISECLWPYGEDGNEKTGK